jgi:hypothetical protein
MINKRLDNYGMREGTGTIAIKVVALSDVDSGFMKPSPAERDGALRLV